jgi:hypothetical protein
MATLTNEKVDERCSTARDWYAGLPSAEARLAFSYELQGFVAAQVGRGEPFDDVLSSILVLIRLLAKAQSDWQQ